MKTAANSDLDSNRPMRLRPGLYDPFQQAGSPIYNSVDLV